MQLEQTHRFLRIEQLRNDSRPCSVTRNFPAQIVLRYASLAAQPGDQAVIQKELSEGPHAVQEQEVNHLARLLIAELCLRGSNSLPSVDRLTDDAVHRLREGRSCLVHRNIQKAYRRSIVWLPAHAANTKAADFVSADAGEQRLAGEPALFHIMNSVTIVGFVGADPEQRHARNNGSKFTVLSVATRRSWKNAEDEWVLKVEWHRVAIFRPRLAEAVLNNIKKGDHVLVDGMLVSSKYERENGKSKKAKAAKIMVF